MPNKTQTLRLAQLPEQAEELRTLWDRWSMATAHFHKIDLKIEQTKTDIIKWMFAFWTGSTITTIGSIIAIIKFLKP